MIHYEVTVDVPEDQAVAFSAYMRRKHIPEILATGCFRAIHFQTEGPVRFRTCYQAATRADLDRYLDQHTAHFRADFLLHFPEGLQVSRQVWEDVEAWSLG